MGITKLLGTSSANLKCLFFLRLSATKSEVQYETEKNIKCQYNVFYTYTLRWLKFNSIPKPYQIKDDF